MESIAKHFQDTHKGKVSHITSYSFTYTEKPKDKDAKEKTTVYMESYFMEF